MALKVVDLRRGDLFSFTNLPYGENEVFEFVENQWIENRETAELSISNSIITRIGFKTDNEWKIDYRSEDQNCNPYANVTLMKLTFIPKEP